MEKSTSVEPILRTLISWGWCFRDLEEIHRLIESKIAAEEGNISKVLEIVEPELLNMDLKLVGGKSIPDPSVLGKASNLQGPKILQLVSLRDIHQSSIEDSFKSLQHERRLLRFRLTDGYSEVIAIEYAPLSSIREEIIPGAKIRLENKVTVNSGILCLNSKSITILGGIVQSLYEEWQMSRKYSGFSRSSLKLSQDNDSVGPPPFQKLQIGLLSSQFTQRGSFNRSYPHYSSSSKVVVPPMRQSGTSDERYTDRFQVPQGVLMRQETSDSKEGDTDGNQTTSLTGRNEDKPSSSISRRKEVAEAGPVQNQASAQKLLQRMSQPATDNRHLKSRNGGPRYRGKGKQEEPTVFTLDEWERRKAGVNLPSKSVHNDVSHDEELARQLQNQLDLEGCQVNMGPRDEAEQIRLSMFNFGRAEEGRNDDRRGFRGRGRGKRRFG